MRLSVIMAVWNAEATVKRAVESCLQQTVEALELVVVNDGSTDGTGDVLEALACVDERVKVRHFSENRGVVAARMEAVSVSSGEFLGIMDADDWSHPGRFERQMVALDHFPGWAGCKTGVRLMNPVGEGMQRYVSWVNSLLTPGDVARERFIESPLIQPAVMLRRRCFQAVGGYRDCGWGEDYDLWLRFLDAGYELGSVEGELLHWEDGAGCLTRSDPLYSAGSVVRAKAHFLGRLGEVRGRGVAVAGAGPFGKMLARELMAAGVDVRSFYEVHPRRIGNRIQGVRVLRDTDLLPGGPVLVGAAGTPGARGTLRRWAEAAEYVEGESFFLAC